MAEHIVQGGPLGGRLLGAFRFGSRGARRYRVDLHGVSIFGPGDQHVLIRWEAVESVTVDALAQGVVVAAEADEIRFPSGSFAMSAADLAARLDRARSIVDRADVIAQLVGDDPAGSDGDDD